ncbi:hypothetical protein M0R45_007829 [Rubus argutus]|uniref:Aminotransferase class I/classII large domain-containing protein n=1 Tax=Rubus argutus TaxID=59490 RepID=A0AAW1Y1E3_RUBAR
MPPKALDYESLNENVKKVQYAIRGVLYLRASELQLHKEGKKIIFTNVGNPHALGQKPLTFPRQVVALCQAPFLLDDLMKLAAISLFGGSPVPYYLEETANWGLDVADLRQSVITARSKGSTVRAMVIINPGNPTGRSVS